MFATAWDEDLDDAQLAAVTHGDAPLVVVAGAGTGKTRTLVARVARLLERGVQPERILLLTFTRRAADDMLARAAALAGRSQHGPPPRGGTFHAVAHQMVSAWAELLGVGAGFSVLDPADAADVMDMLRDEHGLSGREERAPRAATLVDVYSRCVNTARPLGEVVAADFPWCEPQLRGDGGAVPRLRDPQAVAAPAGLRRPAPLLAGRPQRRPARRAAGGDVRPRARRRVPGRQLAPGRDRDAAAAGRARPHRGR